MGTLTWNTSEIQIMRTWSWKHAQYGDFTITPEMLDDFIKNFQENKRGIDLAVDINHEPNHKAVGWIKDLVKKGGDAIFATVEWTKEGLELVKSWAYKYFSPELFFSFRDEESGQTVQNLLVGGAITNRPFFKRMKALAMSETGSEENGEKKDILYFNLFDMSKKFSELKTQFTAKEKITTEEFEDAKLAFSELKSDEQVKELDALLALEKKVFNEEGWEGSDGEDKGSQENGEDKGNIEDKGSDGEDKGNQEDPAPENKEFSEKIFNEIGLTLDEIKTMKKSFSEMERAKKTLEIKDKMSAFVFSEHNPAGKIATKSKDKFVNFASKLSDDLVKEFFELINPTNFQTVELWERGASGVDTPAAKFAEIAKKAPEWVDQDSFVLANLAKEFAEKEGLNLIEATKKAANYIKENKAA